MGLGLRVRDLGLRFEVFTSCRLRDVLAEDFRFVELAAYGSRVQGL